MDSGSLALLIPIAAIVSAAAVKVAKIVTTARAPAPNPDISVRLAEIEAELGSVRRELEEAHERLDFTERLLAQPRAEKPSPED